MSHSAGPLEVAILFARVPVAGKVKTRMIGAPPAGLTAEQACALHAACIGDVAELLDRALPQAQKWLYWSEAPGAGFSMAELRIPASFGVALQSGLDLGERMGRAIERALASGAARVVIIGSDSPTLPQDYLIQAMDALEQADLVLGPTQDGGFYLIGARRFDRAVYHEVPWSTAETFDRTAANAARLGLSLACLPQWYDLDEWADVQRMIALSRLGEPLPPRVAAFVSEAGLA